MAKKTGRKDQISAASLHQELRRPWLVPVLAVFYFLITCLMKHGANKGITLLLLAAAVVCVVVKTAQLGRRMSWPALLLGLYICMDGISTLYAPSGKFALYEFLKVAGAACLALLLTALEPERPGRTGRCAATVLETAGALVSLVSIDTVSTQLLYKLMVSFTAQFGASMQLNTLLQEQRLKTIFENPNVFAGAAGAAILLSLGLAAGAEDRKERCLHLSCLLLNSTAFLLAVSRGAMAAIAAGSRVSMLLVCPFDAMGTTAATYAGQNLGAGKLDRIHQGVKDCTVLGIIISAAIFVITWFGGSAMTTLFLDTADGASVDTVVPMGQQFLLINAAFAIPLLFVNLLRFTIQGLGYSEFAVFAGVFEMVARGAFGLCLVPVLGYTAACFASPAAWVMADVFLFPAYFHCMKKQGYSFKPEKVSVATK